MKAYQLIEWQQPPKLVDIPVPEPGPGQVRLKVAGNGVCQSDLHLIHEWTASPAHIQVELPMTIGHEVAGWIDKEGPGVSGFEQGQAAVITIAGCGHCRYCAQGWNQYCQHKGKQVGMGLDGGLAEFVLAPANAVVPVGDMDPVEAAPLTDAGLSSYHAVKRIIHLLDPGTTVAVIGVGGLGHMAIQELKALCSARIVAYDLNETSLQLAAELGADECLKSDDAFYQPMSADVVLDFVGAAPTIAGAAKMIRPLGHIVVVGRGGGSIDFTHRFMPYGATLSTTFGGSKVELIELISLVEAGHIKPHITRYPLDDVALVLDKLAKGEITGRAVIEP